MTTWRSDEVTVSYDDTGDVGGVPLVLLHGHPFDRTMWYPQLVRHRADLRLIAPDLRGYGGSRGRAPGAPVAPEVFATDVAALLDALGIDEVLLCGLSMGGQVAMAFHRLHPGRVRGLLLSSTSARADDPRGRRARLVAAERILRDGIEGHARELLPLMISQRSAAERAGLRWFVRDMMRAVPPVGAAAALRGRADRPDYSASLARVGVPTVVVVGDRDALTPPAEAVRLCSGIPDAELVVVPGAGHLPNLEDAAAFGVAVDRLRTRALRAGPG